MDIFIRKAQLEDIPSIYALVKELAIYEKEPHAVTASLTEYKADFLSNRFQAHVAISEGIVVAMALHFPIYSSWKGKIHYLDDLIVTEAHRQKGIGQMLFDALRAYAQSSGASMLKWQVLDWNEPAIRFYQKNECSIEKDWWNVKIEAFSK